jgi:hypothetical protein
MTHHNHHGPELHGHGVHGREGEPSVKKFHKDWRVWLAVIIMLVAIITYVLTLDDSIVPAIMGQ